MSGEARAGAKRLERLERLKHLELPPGALRLLSSARVAHLATADAEGRPHVIPICFAFNGKHLYSPIDDKPKKTHHLKRLRNIAENSNVAVVIDHYDEDWKKLAYVLIFSKAKVLEAGVKHRRGIELLRKKYPQYRSMNIDQSPVILLTPTRVTCWGVI